MSLKQQLSDAMKSAMKAKDSLRLTTVRMVLAAVKNREIEQRGELADEEVVGVLSSLVKQRKESVQLYREGGRAELAEKEEAELAILQEFLPAPLAVEEIASLIERAVAETGAAGPRDMGKVMKIVSAETRGRADGKLVSDMVRERLAHG
ncbi:MAG: GatB/YqeY domain-containing protein [Syntrophotalea acetylenica]|jgi:hypothetical protein|uniref:Glutamyl-tRNA amidotransferase n=1 Tax=Syntrophotalea acetylenica TaxID=29542 RepID=A0A1L3GEJ1_SYNAC|nr:GatB/YqeY domain-containing protein [Syntrophotalea acetylenica]APG24384.1 glutamyl-tRNA amidotransferase [Syntrophotalea acetylenica]APG44967.1 glutamyl-tRNA amidotransferase [Syntrophotalea acetylenica]MDD4456103.1 GatB/YqeY domain-containing protein [Syntrophotalea acetylenica]MDY0262448.1 GatB/YqeY domain-containing protein [Syntrophotalea acetylenica]